MKIKSIIVNLVAWTIQKIWSVAPARDNHAYVYGSPSSEGNSFVVARALLGKTNMKVTWVNPPSLALLSAYDLIGSGKLRTLESVWSLKSIRSYLTAKYIFTTTELYGMPTPPPNRVVVNLWHGDGIKGGKFFPNRTLKGPTSTYLVGATRLLRDSRASDADVSPKSVLLTGMPRADLFFEPTSDASLAKLGIPTDKPFILFMPTFRRAKTKKGKMAWSDIGDDYNTKQFEEIFSDANVDLLSNSGINVIVKPHYLDFDNFKIPGLRAISDDEISSAETTLYGLLARSRALVTDYSSVWIDYLHLDKPIAFYAPDEELFWKHRPKDANFDNVSLPGVEIASDKVFLAFIEDLLANRDGHQQARAEVRAALGLISHESNTEELLRALSIIRS